MLLLLQEKFGVVGELGVEFGGVLVHGREGGHALGHLAVALLLELQLGLLLVQHHLDVSDLEALSR